MTLESHLQVCLLPLCLCWVSLGVLAVVQSLSLTKTPALKFFPGHHRRAYLLSFNSQDKSNVGQQLTPDLLHGIMEQRMGMKLKSVMPIEGHPTYNVFSEVKSSFSDRLVMPRCSPERFRKSSTQRRKAHCYHQTFFRLVFCNVNQCSMKTLWN